MTKARILIVEDEDDVRLGLRTVLTTEGYEVLEARDGAQGLALSASERPDLMILDIMIPKLDGFEVCRELRAKGLTLPVLILTARAGEIDKVLGLELGADDYVTKPFGVREVVARVRALLRRAPGAEQASAKERVQIGTASVDLKSCQVQRGDETFPLFHYETEILNLLLQHEGKVVSRKYLLDQVWGIDSFPTTRTVDFHVCNLRKKIEKDPSDPRHILTAHGVGYRLVR